MHKTAAAFLIVLTFIIGALSAQAAIPSSEREALLALYAATDGAHWYTNNNWLGAPGTECSWWGITCNDAGTTVVRINQVDNRLTGTVPPEIANLRNLEDLHLAFNRLRGPIPATIGDMTQLVTLRLAVNELSGSIPANLANLFRLQELSLGQNQFTGNIPSSLGDLSELRGLDLSMNQLSGTIPPELGRLAALSTLNLGTNQLTGAIPPELAGLTKLQSLLLYQNQLTGSIPPEFAALTSLKTIQVHGNRLTGSIPAVLGELPNIERIGISRNQFTGGIPDFFGDLTKLTNLSLSFNDLSGEIPSSLARATSLQSLYLSGNRLSGNIPAALATLGGLTTLWVDRNQLAGAIDPVLKALPICYSRCLMLDYNALYAGNVETDAWVTKHQWNWKATQTLAPPDVRVTAATPTSATLQWTPIPFSNLAGRYEIWVDSGSGAVLRGSTSDKQSSSITVTGLTPGVAHTFALRTITEPHAENQNRVTSDFSTPIPMPTASFSIGDVTLQEGDSGTVSAHLAVTLPITVSSTVTVQYSTVNGTAIAGNDYVGASGTLTFAPGETARSIAVEVLGDTIAESDEIFTVSLSAPVGADIRDGSGGVTIVDDDTLPDPVITVTDCSRVLGPCMVAAGSASGALTNAWQFAWTVDGFPGGTGASFEPTFTVPGVHVVGLTASNAAGSTSATQTIAVLPIGVCPFIFDMPRVTAPATHGVTTAWVATRRDTYVSSMTPLSIWGLVSDNDADGIVTFMDVSDDFRYGLWTMVDPVAPRVAAGRLDGENCYDQEPRPFPSTIFLKNPDGRYSRVQARATLSGVTSFMWFRPGAGAWGRRSTDGDSATDLDGRVNGVILFETSSMEPAAGSVAPPSGGIEPGDFFVALDHGSEDWYGENVDTNLAPPAAGVVSFADSADRYLSEDSGITRVRLQRSGGVAGELIVMWLLSEKSGSHDAGLSPMYGIVRFADGETARDIEFQPVNNPAATGDATFRLQLTDPDGRSVTGPTSLDVIVTDRQTPPHAGVIAFAGDVVFAREDAGVARIVLNRIGGSTGDVSVSWHTETDTAVAGLHFEPSSGTTVFANGETSRVIEVPVIDNAVYTGDVEFRIVLTNPNGTAISGPTSVKVVVMDLESIAPGVFRFANEGADVTVREDAGVARVEVQRIGGIEGEVAVHWQTIEGSAVAGLHYETSSGVATFRHGETSKTLEVPLNLIPFDTGSVRFEIALSDPVGTFIVGPPRIGVIIVGRHGAAPTRPRPVRR